MTTTPTGEQILATALSRRAASACDGTTVRDYLVALLQRLWTQQENFSGKRPFGYSDWGYDLYEGLVTAGLITGRLDDDGYIEDCDDDAGERYILSAIRALGGAA